MALTTGQTILPIMILGALLFLSIITTAIFGLLVIRGKIPFKWHATMAKITVGILIIHGMIAMLYFLGV